jgi:hypothetical protein
MAASTASRALATDRVGNISTFWPLSATTSERCSTWMFVRENDAGSRFPARVRITSAKPRRILGSGGGQDRERGSHAALAPMLLHHLLTDNDFDYLGHTRVVQLVETLAGTHSREQTGPLTRLLTKLDQKSVEEGHVWMTTQADSKVSQFLRAVQTLIENGGFGVNFVGAQVYVMGEKTAVVVPIAVNLARDLLKREKVMLPGNIHLYDLLRQAQLVEADNAGHCVRKIRVGGKQGTVELSALIFATETIVPKQVIAKLPSIQFEIKQADTGDEVTPTAVGDPLG